MHINGMLNGGKHWQKNVHKQQEEQQPQDCKVNPFKGFWEFYKTLTAAGVHTSRALPHSTTVTVCVKTMCQYCPKAVQYFRYSEFPHCGTIKEMYILF